MIKIIVYFIALAFTSLSISLAEEKQFTVQEVREKVNSLTRGESDAFFEVVRTMSR